MDHLKPSFLLDPDVIVEVGPRTEEETKAHFVLLKSSTEVDHNLAIAALLDGNTTDFLFGVKRAEVRSAAAKANDVKKFMRNLDEQGQVAFTKFYFLTYQAILNYQRRRRHICSCLWTHTLLADLHADIDEAYVCLRGLVTQRNILADDH